MKRPELVTKLCAYCDGWLIGSSVIEENPRDYDVWIPYEKWSVACTMIPKDAKINTFGGFKCISDGVEVDVWTCPMSELFQTHYFKAAHYPKSNITIVKT